VDDQLSNASSKSSLNTGHENMTTRPMVNNAYSAKLNLSALMAEDKAKELPQVRKLRITIYHLFVFAYFSDR
jgi:hypothetical protein